MDFNSIAKSLTEAIEETIDLRDAVEIDGMPAKTYRVSELKKNTGALHPKQIMIIKTLLESGKTADEIADLLDYPIEKVREVEKGSLLQTA